MKPTSPTQDTSIPRFTVLFDMSFEADDVFCLRGTLALAVTRAAMAASMVMPYPLEAHEDGPRLFVSAPALQGVVQSGVMDPTYQDYLKLELMWVQAGVADLDSKVTSLLRAGNCFPTVPKQLAASVARYEPEGDDEVPW